MYEPHVIRILLHVHDIAASFLFAIDNRDRMQGQVYNIGSKTMNYSKAQVCEMIRQKVDYCLQYADVGEDADKRNHVISYKKINSLGYETTITLEEGIDELIRGSQVFDVRDPCANV